MNEPWLIDELAHAGPEHLDPAFVAGYDRKQGYPDPAEDLAICEAHGLEGSSSLVDLGAGSGQFALAAARRFGHVTAVDVSPAMIAVLGERAASAGLANLDCVRAGFLSYERSGPPADGVYTRNALHQLPDFWKAVTLDRIASMMRPGGPDPQALPGAVRGVLGADLAAEDDHGVAVPSATAGRAPVSSRSTELTRAHPRSYGISRAYSSR